MESRNNTKSLLNCISQACNFDYIFDGWYNGKIGSISDHSGQSIYRFYEKYKDDNGNLRHMSYKDEECPIVAVGIVAYWLHHRKNENRITTLFGPAYFSSKPIIKQFEDYTTERLNQYKINYEQKPSSWRSDVKRDFYMHYIIPNEKKLNKLSEAIFDYITPADRKLVKELMKEYILYLQTKQEEYIDVPKSEGKKPKKQEVKTPEVTRNVDIDKIGQHFNRDFDKSVHLPNMKMFLEQPQSDKDLARVALLIYESKNFIKKDYNTFSAWYKDFCVIVGCKYHIDYAPSALRKLLGKQKKKYYFL